ncbi:MAG: UDP-galactopyranose mutase [Clostridium sp.]|nr:UDP-galactopyranose mutase [Clostridium sp.]
MIYDYLIVGTGLFGAVFAHEMKKAGKHCLAIEKRSHIGGNIYTQVEHDICVHRYGAHIFHTSNQAIWEYVNQFAEFNHYVNTPVAIYQDELYNLPFNMNTFSKMWGIQTPAQAQEIIQRQREEAGVTNPQNLEEQALSLVGKDVYEKLIKGYTRKQWGKDCTELPAFIIKRLPLRFTYNNNYFSDPYQGIPKDGYTSIIEQLFEGTPIYLNCTYQDFIKENGGSGNRQRDGQGNGRGDAGGDGKDKFEKILYTGMMDEYFDYCLGELPYRSLRFEHEYLADEANYQGNAIVNYTHQDIPYTRIIEHKHFVFGQQPGSVISREYPAAWKRGDVPFYPVNDDTGNALFAKYQELAKREPNVLFGGRLGQFRYYDMDKVIEAALEKVDTELHR